MRIPAAITILLLAAGVLPAAACAAPDGAGRETIPDLSLETDDAADPMLSVLGLAAMAAAATWNVDEDDDLARSLERSPAEGVFDFGNTWGSGWVIGGGATATYVAGSLGNDTGLRVLGADLMRSYALGGAATLVLKFTIDRRRPSGGRYSFPSGHTSAAFSIVPALNRHLGRRAAAPALALGVITALGRVQGRHHYLSDVIFGAAIGLVAGDMALRTGRPHDAPSGVMLAPGAMGYTARF